LFVEVGSSKTIHDRTNLMAAPRLFPFLSRRCSVETLGGVGV